MLNFFEQNADIYNVNAKYKNEVKNERRISYYYRDNNYRKPDYKRVRVLSEG